MSNPWDGSQLVPDPFETPLSRDIEGTPDQALLVRLIPADARRGKDTIVISRRASDPQLVIGSVVGPPCVRCGSRIWVSPSTRTLDLSTLIPLCLTCVATAVRREKGG